MEMDLRLKQLSYSSLLTLHGCPRKYQLYKLGSQAEDTDHDGSQSVTFAYGHVVGLGIQLVLQGKTETEILWELFRFWQPDLFAENVKQVKSFWLAIAAVQKFISLRANGLLKDYELVYHDGLPAVELGFIIEFPDGFVYRGYVDAVLRNKHTGEILVLEVKTTSATNLNPATYKNSAQAIGYSVVLDVLFPALSSYKVLYLVYKTKGMEYEQLPFTKSYLQRALWIQELLLDIETIKLYEGAGVYPMHGESCYEFYRECEYLNLCTLSTANLTEALTEEGTEKIVEENAKYQIKLKLEDLIQAQLAKAA